MIIIFVLNILKMILSNDENSINQAMNIENNEKNKGIIKK